jgi:mannose-6-phosphate isomerase-like protein (cupin superfamily)
MGLSDFMQLWIDRASGDRPSGAGPVAGCPIRCIVPLKHKEAGMSSTSDQKSARFDVKAIAAGLPETASTLLVDHYLTNREAASARVFRVYRPTPPHYHASCDEYLFVLSGRGTFWMEDASTEATFAPGDLLFFERGIVHALPTLAEEPVVFLSVDTPRREPTDIIFVNPEDGTPASFMARNAGGRT